MNMISVQPILAVASGIILLFGISGCGFVHEEKITGPYRLVAVDDSEEMIICYKLDNDDCIGRIPATVFSVGWNSRFIVAKQHPSNDKSVTRYFIINLAKDTKLAEASASVIGPLSITEYTEKSGRLGLPQFTKTFEALK